MNFQRLNAPIMVMISRLTPIPAYPFCEIPVISIDPLMAVLASLKKASNLTAIIRRVIETNIYLFSSRPF